MENNLTRNSVNISEQLRVKREWKHLEMSERKNRLCFSLEYMLYNMLTYTAIAVLSTAAF